MSKAVKTFSRRRCPRCGAKVFGMFFPWEQQIRCAKCVAATAAESDPPTGNKCSHCQTEDAPKLFEEEGVLFCAGCLARHFQGV